MNSIGSTAASGPVYKYICNSNYVAMYWLGLPANKDWLRIDVMRRFNGTPVTSIRDIVDLIRPKKTYDAKKTFDVLYQIC